MWCSIRVATWGTTERGRSVKQEEVIYFGLYNIGNGRIVGLESALHRISQAKIDLGILQEINIIYDVYTRLSAGFCVEATNAPRRHYGSIALFKKKNGTFRWRPCRHTAQMTSASI